MSGWVVWGLGCVVWCVCVQLEVLGELSVFETTLFTKDEKWSGTWFVVHYLRLLLWV